MKAAVLPGVYRLDDGQATGTDVVKLEGELSVIICAPASVSYD